MNGVGKPFRFGLAVAAFLALGAVAALAPALAEEAEGVTLKDSVTVGDKALALNGLGVRRKRMFVLVNVYVAGLYLEHGSSDAAAITSADETKRIEMVFLRDVSGDSVGDAIAEAFEKNSAAQLPALKDRLAKLKKLIPDVKKGDDLLFTYEPGKGTKVTLNNAEKGSIEGHDFQKALFLAWLGSQPADEDLKKALLRGPKK